MASTQSGETAHYEIVPLKPRKGPKEPSILSNPNSPSGYHQEFCHDSRYDACIASRQPPFGMTIPSYQLRDVAGQAEGSSADPGGAFLFLSGKVCFSQPYLTNTRMQDASFGAKVKYLSRPLSRRHSAYKYKLHVSKQKWQLTASC